MTSSVKDRSRPARMTTVISQQPWFRCGTIAQRRQLADTVAETRQRSQERYARVKAHPDLAERLCRSLGYERIDQWNGFIPDGRDDSGKPNGSHARAELVAILHAVREREQATQ